MHPPTFTAEEVTTFIDRCRHTLLDVQLIRAADLAESVELLNASLLFEYLDIREYLRFITEDVHIGH